MLESLIFENGTAGIEIAHSRSITLKNITCRNNQAGIYLYESTAVRVVDSKFQGNEISGITVYRGSGNRMENCEFDNNSDYGVILSESHNNSLFWNTLTTSRYGIRISTSSDNQIINNSIHKNTAGVLINLNSKGNIFKGNALLENDNYGIEVQSNGAHLVMASENFWGSDTGPYNTMTNPGGKGDKVSNSVLYSPWSTKDGGLREIVVLQDPAWGNGDNDDDDSLRDGLVTLSIAMFLLFAILIADRKP